MRRLGRDCGRALPGPGSTSTLAGNPDTIRLDGGEQVLTSSITRDAADDLELAEGSAVTVLIKSTEVALGIE
jgi:molybdopterin-binding protein